MKSIVQNPERTDDLIRFDTYRFYLHSVCAFLSDEHNAWDAFARQWLLEAAKLPPLTTIDEKWIARFLKLSWNTEYLLAQKIDDVELARVSNQWLPVQAYYAVYSAAEALAYSIDGHKTEGHAKTLRKTSDWLVKHGPRPWCFAFTGARGKSGGEAKPVRLPNPLMLPSNLQRIGVQPVQMIAKCLKAEHSHRIDDSWRRGCGKKKYEYAPPGPTTVLHFLYRLRIKANYGNVDLFLADAPDDEITGFGNHLRKLCYWTLLMMEIVVRRRILPSRFDTLASSYLTGNPDAKHLAMRCRVYLQAI